jgi:hypothetical protein
MGTTAAIYDATTQQAIIVRFDGFPKNVVPHLEKILANNLRDTLFALSDYITFDTNPLSAFDHLLIPGIGLAHQNQEAHPTVKHKRPNSKPVFYEGDTELYPDYSYTITTESKIITHRRGS